ncbi:hypothetical protein MSNKSG1_14707 [Marinobacter santoriniensis NKSG1]|uniref:DUF4864 domain-containing protein n=1 Tax=Marinobacter santoriniensis NKSG1 TaxID=1288826 RepID=M7CN14_9GAMM|nr:DUF4864 domain-containing protein [Marinobacter santoriniensis]EMP54569.1 hypothetical protein MSNKSG1_14707 [Marinobacter santoriniensis NKSG1]
MRIKRTEVRLGLMLLVLGITLLLMVSPVPGAESEDNDRAIHNTILGQIEAFANDDEAAAWQYASDGVRRRFGSPDLFVDMVRQTYPAVYRASSIEFAERVPHGDFDIQVVHLSGPEGKRWDAYYRMVRIDGEWKVSGVVMQPADMGI